MKSIISLITFFSFMPFVSANSADLADLQSAALDNRQLVQRYKNNLEKAVRGKRIAMSRYYPSVDIAYTVNSFDESSTYEAKENSILHGAVSANLFAGFKDKYNVTSASLIRNIETYKLNGIEQDILQNVALHYLGVYSRQANLKARQDIYSTLERVYEDGKKRNEVGLIDKNALLKIKVDLDFAAIQIKKAQAGLDKSLLLLQRQTGSTIQFPELTFTEFQSIPPRISLDEYEKEMLKNRTELKVLEKLVEVHGAEVEMAKAAHYPQLDFITSYQGYDNDYVSGNGDNFEGEFRAQLALSMNLFNGFATRENVARAKIEQRSARLDLEELQSDLKAELASLYLDYEVSRDNIKAAQTNINQARQNLRFTRLKYNEGMQTESELLDGVSTLSRAEYNYVVVMTTLHANYFRILRMAEQLTH